MKKIFFSAVLIIFISFGCKSSILEDPITTIEFDVPVDSYCKLTLENSYHTIVATLMNWELVYAGTNSVEVDMSVFAEGVYFYTLELKGGSYHTKTTKMFLVAK